VEEVVGRRERVNGGCNGKDLWIDKVFECRFAEGIKLASGVIRSLHFGEHPMISSVHPSLSRLIPPFLSHLLFPLLSLFIP
jgi:hypothetical protein